MQKGLGSGLRKQGYRVNRPEEDIAWKVLNFEYTELGNEHLLADFSGFLSVKGDWPTVLSAFRARCGDATGIWLTRSKRAANEYYGDYGGDLLVYEYDPKLIVSDLGDEGRFVLNAELVSEPL